VRAVRAWFHVTWVTAFGLILVTSPWWHSGAEPIGARAALGLVLLGLAVLSIAPCFVVLDLRRTPARVELVRAPEPRIEVRLDQARNVVTAVVALAWTAFLGAGAVMLAEQGGAGGTVAGVVSGLLALFGIALLGTVGPSLLRDPRLVLDGRGVRFVGWSVEAYAAWADVVGAEVAVPHFRRPVLRIRTRAGAPSYSFRRSWRPLRTDLTPADGAIDVPLLALADATLAGLLLWVGRVVRPGADRGRLLDGLLDEDGARLLREVATRPLDR
jgi:hypothetical protein